MGILLQRRRLRRKLTISCHGLKSIQTKSLGFVTKKPLLSCLAWFLAVVFLLSIRFGGIIRFANFVWQVCLSFYETRNKHMAWFSKVERLYWEQWCIQLHVLPPAPLKTKKFYDSVQSGDIAGEFLLGTLFCLLGILVLLLPSVSIFWNLCKHAA